MSLWLLCIQFNYQCNDHTVREIKFLLIDSSSFHHSSIIWLTHYKPCCVLLAVDKNGSVCISILHEPGDDNFGYEKAEERWLPIHTVETILISVISMLADPNDESPANVDAAKEWRERPDEFKKRVVKCVRRSQEELWCDSSSVTRRCICSQAILYNILSIMMTSKTKDSYANTNELGNVIHFSAILTSREFTMHSQTDSSVLAMSFSCGEFRLWC